MIDMIHKHSTNAPRPSCVENCTLAGLLIGVNDCLCLVVNPRALSYSILISSHLKLFLATATHNFKWLKMYVIYEI